MAEEMQQLRDLVAQLQADNARLQTERRTSTQSDQVAGGSGSSTAQATERLIFLPREKRCPVFRGSSGIGIDEWVDEAQACMRVRHLSVADQAYFLFDHLEGEAREEIRHRSRLEREDPEKIVEILQELYGCPQSYVALQEAFFSRKQQEGESLLEFSIALLNLMEKVKGRAPQGMRNADVLLRDQFVEHVCDCTLRRELKQLIRREPTCTLIEVRKEAIRWEQEGRPDGPRARSYSLPSGGFPLASCAVTRGVKEGVSPNLELEELKDMLRQQQSQISQLTQSVAALQALPRRQGPSRDGPLICRRCRRPGHYANECEGERVFHQPPVTSATTGGQPPGPGPFREGPPICRRCQCPGHYARDCEGERVRHQSLTTLVTATPGSQPSRPIQPSEN